MLLAGWAGSDRQRGNKPIPTPSADTFLFRVHFLRKILASVEKHFIIFQMTADSYRPELKN
jgi:hypothetical protein